ncbi:MAG: aldehyde ferredoxin oxidoreductase N-terminal domain-containing protein [Desulfobacterales bacterium]|nr:aldehyde ferredoxin oxidoreductase N-terminal domain-containing protein [Desulfobacterales bacterium]
MGYMRGGTILRIDLSSGSIAREPTAEYERLWIGARGLNSRILYNETGPEVDPLDPANVLMLSLGPFTGTMVPGSGRVEVAAKSPVNGIQGMGNMGGYWGPELKYAGYDSIVLNGKAQRPVYIAIHNDEVTIKDATHLWGMDTYQTQDAIRQELGDPEVEVVCIGPAGERMIPYASIHNRLGNAAGRTGMGCVMGSKNLKAIAVRGTKGVAIAEPERFFELCLEALQVQKPQLGMAKTIDLADNDPPSWGLTLGNYEATEWEKQKELKDGHKPFWENHKNRQGEGITGCFNCQVRCMDYYELPEWGPLVASCNLYASTTWVMKDPDMKSWYGFVSKCQRQGIDSTSVSRMIAWAMELYEQGKITAKDTDGIQLNWGDQDAISQMVDKIIKQEGFGEVLASNPAEAAQKIGGDVEEALQIKGLPLGGTNVMNFRARTIGAVVNPRGGDEYRARVGSFDNLGSGKDAGMTGMSNPDSWEAKSAMAIIDAALEKKKQAGEEPVIGQFDYEARGALAALGQKISTISDTLGQCKWNTIFLNIGISIEFQANALSAGEGRETNIEELLEAAARISCQERAYAVREGMTKDADTLPKKLLNYSMAGTYPEDQVTPEDLEQMKKDYYQAMGWDVKTGIPTLATLRALNLEDVASDLIKQGKLKSE